MRRPLGQAALAYADSTFLGGWGTMLAGLGIGASPMIPIADEVPGPAAPRSPANPSHRYSDPVGGAGRGEANPRILKRNGDRIKEFEKTNKSDPRLLFLKTQQRILEKLLKNQHFASDANAGRWLVRLLKVFMDSLENALNENIAGARGRWQSVPTPPGDMLQFMHGQKAGPWWYDYKGKASDEYRKSIAAKIAVTEQEVWALVMAKIHILDDLFHALLYEGAGTDDEWKMIGDIVLEAANEVGGKPDWLSTVAEKTGFIFDVLKMRKEMRERVKELLRKIYGIDTDKQPYQGAGERIEKGYKDRLPRRVNLRK